MNTLNEIAENMKKIADLRSKLYGELLKFPDNPKITRISKSVNAFTINSSDLSKDMKLSPQYYDFRLTYHQIIEWINNMSPDKIFENLSLAVERGFFMHKNQRYFLHADVIEKLKTLIPNE
jgi:hypothetical protein